MSVSALCVAEKSNIPEEWLYFTIPAAIAKQLPLLPDGGISQTPKLTCCRRVAVGLLPLARLIVAMNLPPSYHSPLAPISPPTDALACLVAFMKRTLQRPALDVKQKIYKSTTNRHHRRGVAAYAGRAAQPAHMQAGHKKAPVSDDTGARRMRPPEGRTPSECRLAGYRSVVKIVAPGGLRIRRNSMLLSAS